MNAYVLKSVKEGRKEYFYLYDTVDEAISALPSKYLMFLLRSHKSPNTVRHYGRSLAFYLSFLSDLQITLGDVFSWPYSRQYDHFEDFLYYVKEGKNTAKTTLPPKNNTANAYLRDVFGFLTFLSLEESSFGDIKVLCDRTVYFRNAVGVKMSRIGKTFRGYLPAEEEAGRIVSKDEIRALYLACTNVRDKLLILLLSETGFRIGEILGIRYTEDIDFEKREVKVNYRPDNENKARAKNAELRRALISEETYEVLMKYLADYADDLKDMDFLFITLSGKAKGQPLTVDSVYSLFDRLYVKTGILATPHMFRRYFATERYKNNWDMVLISHALGHKKLETTEKYLRIGPEMLSDASEEYYRKNEGLIDISGLI